MKTMMSKSLGEFTIAELEAIDEEIQSLRQRGRLKRKLEKAQENRAFQEKKKDFVNAILDGNGIKKIKGKGKATRNDELNDRVDRIAKAWILTQQRLFDLLDGGKNFKGIVFDYFVNRANDFIQRKGEMVDKRKDKVLKKAEELGINIRKLGTTVKIDGYEYSKDEIMDIYAGFKNPLKKAAIIYGNELPESIAEKLINTLSEKEKQWADYIISEYEENYYRLRIAHIIYTNEDLGKETNYTPMQRMDADYDGVQIGLAQDLLEMANMKKAYAGKGFTQGRIIIGKEHQKRLNLGLTATWLEHVDKQEHYINGAKLIKEMQRMVNDKDFSEAVRQRYGSEVLKAVRNNINKIANPEINKLYDYPAKLSRLLRNNTAIGFLAGNIVSMSKQPTALLLYLPEAGLPHLMKSTLEFATIFKARAMMERAERLDTNIKHRTFDRFQEDLKQADLNAYDKIIKKVGRVGMYGMYIMDKIPTVIGWNATYEAYIAKGYSPEQAVTEARNATQRTQQLGAVKDLAQLYTHNEFINWMLMFTSQANQVFNMIYYDTPMRAKLAWKEKDFTVAGETLLTLAGVGLSQALVWMIANKRVPEDDEDAGEIALETFFGTAPILGKIIASSYKGFYGMNSIEKLIKGFTSGDPEMIFEGLAPLMGLPFLMMKRTYSAIEEQDLWELIGGAP